MAVEKLEILIKAVDQASGQINQVAKNTKSLGVVSAAAFISIAKQAAQALKSVLNFATAGLTLADRMDKLSLRLGIGTEALSVLGFAAERSGTDLGTLETGLRTLAAKVFDVEQGLATAKQVFDELGISVRNSDDSLKSLDDLLPEIADKFSGMEDETKKAALAQEIFGGAGLKLIPLLDGGAKGLEAFAKEAKALGIVITEDAAAGGAEFADRLTDAQRSVQGLQLALATQLGPALVDTLEGFTTLVKKIIEFTSQLRAADVTNRQTRVALELLNKDSSTLRLEFRKLLIEIEDLEAGTEEFNKRAREFDQVLKGNKAQAVGNILILQKKKKAQEDDTEAVVEAGEKQTEAQRKLSEIRDQLIADEIEKNRLMKELAGLEGLALLDKQHGLELAAIADRFAEEGATFEQFQALQKALEEKFGQERNALKAKFAKEDADRSAADRALQKVKDDADNQKRLDAQQRLSDEIIAISSGLSNVLLKNEADRGNALKGFLQQEFRTRGRALISQGIKELLVKSGIEVGKAAAAGPLSFGISLLAIPLILAATAAAEGILNAIPFQKGGFVRGGVAGQDSVPAMLTPGELVLPKPVADFFKSTSKAGSSGPGFQGGGFVAPAGPLLPRVSINIERIDVVSSIEAAQSIATELNNLIESRGGRLVSSEVLS